MGTRFHKMHGYGNDFVILDAREGEIAVDGALAAKLCDRNRGIGCDQLIRLSNAAGGAVRMDIWNADGGEAEACGNAARCVVALTGAERIETPGGLLEGKANDLSVTVTLPEPKFQWDQIPLADVMDTAPLPMAWDALESPDAVNVGNPHLVFFVDDVAAVPLDELGPRIEHDPAFPERINVNIVETDPRGIRIRTWERGAGLTQACGTGACASAVAAIRRKKASAPVIVMTPGGTMHVSWAPGEPIQMTGAATHVFSGEIDLEAFE